MILDNTSAYFLFDNCKFGNEKYKANCARLGIHRDFKLLNSFTIEASCYAYDIKGTDEVEQFKEDHFLKFGEHLVHSIAQHLDCTVNEIDLANMAHGFDIELDFALYIKDPEDAQQKRKKKKKEKTSSPVKKRIASDPNLRESRDSSRRGTSQKFRGEPGRHDRDTTSASSSKSRGKMTQVSRAQITQTKFEINPPNDQTNNVVLVMNQSQRDYFKIL